MILWSPENSTFINTRLSDLSFEMPLWSTGWTLVAGLDEAGKVPWLARYRLPLSYYPDPNVAPAGLAIRNNAPGSTPVWAERLHSLALCFA
jgi:hypothetical protein